MRQAIGRFVLLAFIALFGLIHPAPAATQEATPMAGDLPDGVEVVASGLTNPRGLTWGADGTLFLALAGTGGESPGTLDDGTPDGFFGGPSGSVVSIEDGCAVPVAEGLASGLWRDVGWIWGPMDVAILGDQMYVLSGGGGIEAGSPDVPNGVYRINADGSTELVADLSAWFRENPPAFTPPDYGQDGSLFELEAGEDRLWLTEAVGGRVMTVTPDGEIALVADLSEDHMVPAGLTLDGEGGVYVGHETVVPYPEGLANVLHVAADGTATEQWTGLTAMAGLTTSPDGVLYAAELATNNTEEPPHLTPDSGRIVRQTGADSHEAVVTDINYPVGLEFGPDGMLYMTYPAWGPDAGEGLGALLRIDPAAGPISLAGIGTLPSSCAGDAGGVDDGGTGDATPAAAASTDAASDAVTIVNFAFAPDVLEVPAGTTVVWTNEDGAPHTATADEGTFDSDRLDQGASFSYTFDTPGEYAYHCQYHPMAGAITVT